MEDNISIRRAKPHDVCDTAKLFSAALKSMAFFPKLHSDEEDRAFLAREIEESEVWLVLEDGAVRGFAALDGDWLDHLYVDPAFHGLGFGSTLMAHVKLQCPLGFQLWCFQANTGARRFYERHGCVAAEFTDGRGNEEKLPDLRYVWRR